MSDDADIPDEQSDAPTSSADRSDDAQNFPWQRQEKVDLDLHGAPTWDPSEYEAVEGDETSTSSNARGKLFRRGRPSPTPHGSHARGSSPDGTDASVVTERVAQEQREAARVAAARVEAEREADREAERIEVRAGEEVSVDLIDSEDLDVGGAPLPAFDDATSPARPPSPAPATPSSAPLQARPPGPSPAPAPVVAPPVAAASAVVAQPQVVEPQVVEPELVAAPVPPVPPRPSPFANPMPAQPARDVGQREPVDLAKADDAADDDVADPAAEAVEADETADPAQRKRKRGPSGLLGRHRSGLVGTVVTLAIAVLVAVLLRVFVVQPYYIPSASMEPTLHGCPGCTDDRVIVDKLSYHFRDIHSGDIVVFDKPPNAVGINDDVLIKRVVARGGDTLTLKNDRVFVNGRPDDENYLDRGFLAKNCPGRVAQPETGKTTWKIPDDDVFVMGDNRCNSDDSRTFGPIKKDSIVGRAVFIIWPFSRIGGI